MTNVCPSAQDRFEEQALEHLFRVFENRNFRYVVLRNFEGLPWRIDGTDLDILVHSDDFQPALLEICKVAKLVDAHFAKYYFDDMMTQLVMTKRDGPRELLTIKIDVLHNRQIFGVEFLSSEEMLSQPRSHNGVPVASAQVMLLDKLSFHLLLGVRLDEKYDECFSEIAREHRVSLVNTLSRFLEDSRAREVVAALIKGEASTIALSSAERRRGFRKLWHAQGVYAIPRSLRFGYFRVRDRLRPPGVFLSISGPDGSGKTTVIEMVKDQLTNIYGTGSVSYAHFRPAVLPRLAEVANRARALEVVDENYDQPHRARPSGVFGSAARLFYYCLDYGLGYFRTVRPVLKRRQVMLFDRYYFDLIADSLRSRISLPISLLRLVGRLLPLPRFSYFISTDPAEIRRRKQELTLDQIKLLNDRYGDLVRRGWLIRIDNNGAPEKAASDIVDHIILSQHKWTAGKLE